MADRDELGIRMLCAWNNIPRNMAPPEWSQISNAFTREAWARVAEAAIEYYKEQTVGMSPSDIPKIPDATANLRNAGFVFGEINGDIYNDAADRFDVGENVTTSSVRELWVLSPAEAIVQTVNTVYHVYWFNGKEPVTIPSNVKVYRP